MMYCLDCEKTFKTEDAKRTSISISGIGIRHHCYCPHCDSCKVASVFVEEGSGIECQIKSGEYKKISDGITLQDFKAMMRHVTVGLAPTKEKPNIWMQDGHTFKNDGEQIYILLERNEWKPCEFNQETKNIKLL